MNFFLRSSTIRVCSRLRQSLYASKCEEHASLSSCPCVSKHLYDSLASWAQSLLRSIVHKVEGCCAGGNYKTDNVAAIRCEFSIPSGMLVATRGEGKLSVTEQVQVFVEETVDRTGQTRNEGPSPSSARHHNDDHHSLRPRAIGKITV